MKEEDLTDFNRISWMKGIWEGKQGDAVLYESWRSKSYRSMEGISYTTVDDRRVYIQTMTIEQSNNKIILSITNKQGTEQIFLELTDIAEDKVVFVNPSDGYPGKIVYQKDKNKMIVELSGSGGNEENTQRFEYRKTEET